MLSPSEGRSSPLPCLLDLVELSVLRLLRPFMTCKYLLSFLPLRSFSFPLTLADLPFYLSSFQLFAYASPRCMISTTPSFSFSPLLAHPSTKPSSELNLPSPSSSTRESFFSSLLFVSTHLLHLPSTRQPPTTHSYNDDTISDLCLLPKGDGDVIKLSNGVSETPSNPPTLSRSRFPCTRSSILTPSSLLFVGCSDQPSDQYLDSLSLTNCRSPAVRGHLRLCFDFVLRRLARSFFVASAWSLVLWIHALLSVLPSFFYLKDYILRRKRYSRLERISKLAREGSSLRRLPFFLSPLGTSEQIFLPLVVTLGESLPFPLSSGDVFALHKAPESEYLLKLSRRSSQVFRGRPRRVELSCSLSDFRISSSDLTALSHNVPFADVCTISLRGGEKEVEPQSARAAVRVTLRLFSKVVDPALPSFPSLPLTITSPTGSSSLASCPFSSSAFE